MVELRNEFSWSKTRDEVFRTCPRQYWFYYYGYWNGWLEDAPERTREIYILRNLKNRHIWVGEKVHRCIERSLKNIRRGIRVLSIDEIISITQYYSNIQEFPKTCGLFEHEYGIGVTDEEWKEVARNVETCLRNFYSSEIYNSLRSHRGGDWLGVEEFSYFYLDNTKVNLVIDCAIREGSDIIIYDWKTGKGIPEDLPIQLSCYALYALDRWNIALGSLRVIEYNLLFNKVSEFSITHSEVENIKGYIIGSIKDMRSLLVDEENNIPLEEERFSRVEDESVSGRCNFRKVCKPFWDGKKI